MRIEHLLPAAAPPSWGPRDALGTPAALPPAARTPLIAAPTLSTGPIALPVTTPRRSRAVGRVAAVVAGLVVAGAVVAQFTAPRSLAEVPVVATDTTSVPPTSASTASEAPEPSDVDSGGGTGAAVSTSTDETTTPSGDLLPFDDDTRGDRHHSRPAPSASGDDDDDAASDSPSSTGSPSRSGSPTTSGSPSASGSPATSGSPSASGSSSASPAGSPTAGGSGSPDPTTSAPTASSSPTGSASSSAPAAGSGTIRSLRSTASGQGNSDVSLGAGSYRFDDFGDSLIGVNLTGDLVGAGSASTEIRMNAHSSSKKGSVPHKDWTTNQLSLLKISGASRISGFTLRGTDQDHLYNGLRISKSSGTRISDVKVIGVPGGDDIPPGETFGINDFHTDGAHYSDVEVDGNGIASADFGTNSSANTVIEDSWFHDSGHANGATFWQTRNVTVKNTRSTGNYDAGFNFERVSGTVLLDHVTVKGNRLSHLRIDSDQGSATYRIIDPVFDGPKLKILMTAKYMGSPNLQKRSDVHVIIGGVDRTDEVVQWVTHF